MSDNSSPVSSLPIAQTMVSSDRIMILYNAISNGAVANGSPSVRTITLSNFSNSFLMTSNVPANSTSNGVSGTFTFDNNYFYVCTSNNVWSRAQLSTW